MKKLNTVDYDQFVSRKIQRQHCTGFEPTGINGKLFDWQREIVAWAARCGRAALFEDCGLGKTPQQLEWASQVVLHTGRPVLGLCPLAVADQTTGTEATKFGIKAKHVRTIDQFDPCGINYTNYERLHIFEAIIPLLGGVVLDESSILKSFSGKTTQRIIELFKATPYRLCCTATPAPNDYEELGNHAEFLGYGTRFEMLATYFVHDSANTADWRLKKHARGVFWKWVATWAACVTKPSDLGYSDDGFVLPPLNVVPVEVVVDEQENANGELFRMPTMSGTSMHAEMRLTCRDRVAKAAEIVNGSKETFVVWCNTNYEADELRKEILSAVEVRGSDESDYKEKSLREFTEGKFRVIISKPSIAGMGLNWQHCANHVFVGLSYSFEDFYQALRRGYRFGQKRPFTAYVVQAQTEGAVRVALLKKMEAHAVMQEEMKTAAAELKLNLHKKGNVKDQLNVEIESVKRETWELFHGDCVRVAKTLSDESVGFSIYSPPFANLYVYSSDVQDMGNSADNDDFIEQYRFLVKEKLRITRPGRLTAVHCADLPAQIWKDGYMGLKDFSSQIRQVHEDEGWVYHCRATVWKDPVVEMQRTKALGLLYKQLRKDSTRCRVGNPDYVMVFRKPGENSEPVEHNARAYPVDQWQKDASPVWMDIDQTNVLSRDGAREQNDERHICPLQLDVIRRCLRLWSNKADLVFSPFAGIGSEGYCAVEMGRRFVGSELKRSYFDQAVQWIAKADREACSQFKLGV